MDFVEKPLPIQCYASAREEYRPRMLESVRFIVQHFFSAIYVRPESPWDPELCWQLFRDMNFPPEQREFGLYTGERLPASAHVLIARDGAAWLLVPFQYQAWHAGESEWQGMKNLNHCSIGIENIGAYGQPFTDAQYRTNARICRELIEQHGIGADGIVGHEQVAMPRGRKKDPGPTFDWDRLERYLQEAA